MWGGESHYGKMNLQFQYYLFLSIFQMKIFGENELQLVPTMWGIVALNGKMNLQFQYYSGYPLWREILDSKPNKLQILCPNRVAWWMYFSIPLRRKLIKILFSLLDFLKSLNAKKYLLWYSIVWHWQVFASPYHHIHLIFKSKLNVWRCVTWDAAKRNAKTRYVANVNRGLKIFKLKTANFRPENI